MLLCSYEVKDIPTSIHFYSELLKWWSDVREKFDTEKVQQNNDLCGIIKRYALTISLHAFTKKALNLVLSKLLTFFASVE